MSYQISRAIYSTTKKAPKELSLLAHSKDSSSKSAAAWRAAAPLEPPPLNGTGSAQAVAILKTAEQAFIAAQAGYTSAQDPRPIHIYTHVPRPLMQAVQGNLDAILVDITANATQNATAVVNPVPINGQGWGKAARETALQGLLALYDDFTQVLSLLNAALQREGLLISNFPGKTEERLTLLQGLMALLPAPARADLTFCTHNPRVTDLTPGRVAFGVAKRSNRRTVDWAQRHTSLDSVAWSPYVELLAGWWQGRTSDVLDAVDHFDPLVHAAAYDGDLIDRLGEITRQYTFHTRVAAEDETVTIDDLKQALGDAERLPQHWRRHYTGLLLDYALENRDPEANALIAGQMDADPDLDADLQTRMGDTLRDAPDLVYVFVRQRLAAGVDPRWLRRLRNAAQSSMNVALDSENPELIASWLRLIAREPNRFELDTVLRDGLRAAVPFGYDDSEFALSLLVIAARFHAGVLDEMLNDAALMDALLPGYRQAFTDFDPDALAELQNHSTSLFLAALKRAADAQQRSAFEAGAVERLWALYTGDKKYNVNAPYTPDAILQTCAQTGAGWMPDSGLETLLGVLLENRDDKLFPVFTARLAEENMLGVHLARALIQSGVNVNRALDTTAMLVSSNKLPTDEAVSVYIMLLESWGWNENTQPIMESLARLLTQNADLIVPEIMLNQLLESAAELRDDASARVAALRLLGTHENETDEEALAAVVQRIFSLVAWSGPAREAVLVWWRSFVQDQPTARLTRLDKALEGSRVTEDALQTLRSVAALRRVIGKRDVHTFAQDVSTAYEVLETLSEAFEPSARNAPGNFEPQTVRALLATMTQELSPQQRQILANSLKELANVVAHMGDTRTRAGLGRTKDALDRQFSKGEQTPQSAIDAMKWIAGYLGGNHNQDEDN